MFPGPSRDCYTILALDGLFSGLSVKKSAFFGFVFKSGVPLKFRKFPQLTMVSPEVFEVFLGHSRDCYIVFKPEVPC